MTAFFVNSGAVIAKALTKEAPLNGMYLFFTSDTATPISGLSDLITSGATIQEATSAAVAGGIGVARISAICESPVSGGAAVVTSGGSTTLSSGGTILYMGNTANHTDISSSYKLVAGTYARAVSLVNLSVAGANYDTGFDYNELSSGGVVLPANGTITLIDEVTVQ